MNIENYVSRWIGVSRQVISRRESTSSSSSSSTSWLAQVVHPHGRNSLLIPAWNRGVLLRMQTMGQMSVQYMKMNAADHNYIQNIYGPEAKHLNYLLQVRPNPIMSASQMLEQIEFHKIYYGNAYVYIDRAETGEVRNLWLCSSGSYNPLTDTYVLCYSGIGGPKIMVTTESRNVLHFKSPYLTDDQYSGVSLLSYAMKALSIAATADEQTLQDVAKGGRHKVLLQEEKSPTLGTRGRLSQKELSKVRSQFADDWASGDVVMLDNLADAKIISQTSQQLQLLEERSFEVKDIARLLGIPLIMMMENSGSAYTEPAHATQEFLLRTIQPIIKEQEDELNSKLLFEGDWGTRCIHISPDALFRLDMKGQAELDKLRLDTGWSVNELRQNYNLPNIKEGDAHYVSTNLAEVGSDKLRSNGGGAPANQQPATKKGE